MTIYVLWNFLGDDWMCSAVVQLLDKGHFAGRSLQWAFLCFNDSTLARFLF